MSLRGCVTITTLPLLACRNLWCEPRTDTSSKPSALSRLIISRLLQHQTLDVCAYSIGARRRETAPSARAPGVLRSKSQVVGFSSAARTAHHPLWPAGPALRHGSGRSSPRSVSGSGTAPPSGLPAISPTRGEISLSADAPRLPEIILQRPDLQAPGLERGDGFGDGGGAGQRGVVGDFLHERRAAEGF